jgi:hypothetical protein
MRPRFYAPYESQLELIRGHARTLEELEKKYPEHKSRVDVASHKLAIPAARIRWLPVHHRKGFWTALIDSESGKPLAYIDLDPN